MQLFLFLDNNVNELYSCVYFWEYRQFQHIVLSHHMRLATRGWLLNLKRFPEQVAVLLK